MLAKLITNILANDANLTSLIPSTSMYPYVMNSGTPLPGIVYTIDSIIPEYDKSGWADDQCIFSVVSFSDNYAILQSIVSAVRSALELKTGTYENISIDKIYLTGRLEGYNINEDVYLSKLTFSARLTTKV